MRQHRAGALLPDRASDEIHKPARLADAIALAAALPSLSHNHVLPRFTGGSGDPAPQIKRGFPRPVLPLILPSIDGATTPQLHREMAVANHYWGTIFRSGSSGGNTSRRGGTIVVPARRVRRSDFSLVDAPNSGQPFGIRPTCFAPAAIAPLRAVEDRQ